MISLSSTAIASPTVASVESVPVQSYPKPDYSVADGLCNFAIAIVVTSLLCWLAFRQDKKSNQTIVLLQRQATLERIYRTHYWSQDYRTQDASEDYRSATLSRPSEDDRKGRSQTAR